jgi:predicted aspartyl protease
MTDLSRLARLTPRLLAIAALGAWSALGGALASAQAPTLAEIRDQAIASLPVPDGRSLGIAGTATASGVEQQFELVFDGGGRVTLELDGPLGATVTYDGASVWAMDSYAGVPYPLDLSGGDSAHAWLAVWSGRWVLPDFPFRVTGPEVSDDGLTLSIESPRSSFRADLLLDGETFAPREFVTESMGSTARTSFAGDFLVERVVRRNESGATDTFVFESLFDEGPEGNRFERPAPMSRNATFLDDVDPELYAEKRSSGHLEIMVAVNGVEAKFLFDTGAGVSTIDPALVEEAGLELFGRTEIRGAGANVTPSMYASGGALEVGPLVLEDVPFMVMESRSVFGGSGIVGWDVLIQAIVEVDADSGEVRLFDPSTYELEGAEWRPLNLHSRHPHFTALFGDGGQKHEGLFRLDTGAGSSSVTFHSPTVAALGLLAGRDTTPSSSTGAGGIVRSRAGTIDWFEIEGHRVREPTVRFCLDEEGALADPDTMGNLGMGLVRPFVLVFDYQRQRMAFVRRD